MIWQRRQTAVTALHSLLSTECKKSTIQLIKITFKWLPKSPSLSSELTDLKVSNLVSEIYNKMVTLHSTEDPQVLITVSGLFLAQPGCWDWKSAPVSTHLARHRLGHFILICHSPDPVTALLLTTQLWGISSWITNLPCALLDGNQCDTAGTQATSLVWLHWLRCNF